MRFADRTNTTGSWLPMVMIVGGRRYSPGRMRLNWHLDGDPEARINSFTWRMFWLQIFCYYLFIWCHISNSTPWFRHIHCRCVMTVFIILVLSLKKTNTSRFVTKLFIFVFPFSVIAIYVCLRQVFGYAFKDIIHLWFTCCNMWLCFLLPQLSTSQIHHFLFKVLYPSYAKANLAIVR